MGYNPCIDRKKSENQIEKNLGETPFFNRYKKLCVQSGDTFKSSIYGCEERTTFVFFKRWFDSIQFSKERIIEATFEIEIK